MPVVNLISLLLRGIDLKTDKEIVPKKLAILLQTNNTKCKLQKCIWNKVKMKAGKSVLVKAIDKRQNLLSNCPRKPSWTKYNLRSREWMKNESDAHRSHRRTNAQHDDRRLC
ncbi:hypothetical protein T4E_11416 [Trichinella pseudospiralis]|uniref:Uncharacterized protein n=1 Tax=Trichinella pseudospiralis TaxID=6337 RepID=A0A0V0YME8_TRIPS|nr:hypothetical protein T4E_11416 [Trichinella pseudospiralis]